MTSDSSIFIKKIRHLSQALMISGALNIGVLSLLLYWVLREQPPNPYCELKPASFEQQQVSLADQPGFNEVLAQLIQLPFPQLANRLTHTQLVEDGYAERDLALACLITFHHFDIQRALPKTAQPQQKRLLSWKPQNQEKMISLEVYPDLNQQQFDSLIQFAKTERWPLTAEGLFLQLQEQKRNKALNDDLVETFVLTPEFWTVELLFNRSGQQASRQNILNLILEGNWGALRQFVDQQRHLQDSSEACRQKFLLDYLKGGSPSAAQFLLKIDEDFAIKKLDDQQVIAILQLMSTQLPESRHFAKEMLTSPRSTNVWRQASQWLYTQAGESMPTEWNHQATLARFVPEKVNMELLKAKSTKPLAAGSSSLPLVHATKVPVPPPIKPVKPTVIKSIPLASQPKPKVVKPSAPAALKKPADTKKVVSFPFAKPIVYLVQDGDSLWKIARRFKVKVEKLKAYNDLKSDKLKPGTALKIPPEGEKAA